MPIEPTRRWRAILGPVLKQHGDWYERGGTGDGRLVLADETIPHANVSSLCGASFTRCDMSGLKCSLMDDIELVDCNLNDAGLNQSNWCRAKINGGAFQRAWMGLSEFEDAEIRGGDWRTAYLESARWVRTSIADVDFGGAYLVDAMFEESTITNCTFWVANMSRRKTEGKPLGRMANSRFIGCDFRNTTITGMQMEGVVFERCRFHGVIGAPAPGFDVTLIEPDFASTGDRRELIDPGDMIAQWRAGETVRRR